MAMSASRNYVALVAIALCFFTVLPTVNAQAKEDDTVESYREYLEDQPSSAVAVEQFDEMSRSDQQAVVEYVEDVDVAEQIAEALASDDNTVALAGGDVVVKTESASSGPDPALNNLATSRTYNGSSYAAGSGEAWVRRSVYVLGSRITSITTWVNYRWSSSGRATKVYSAGNRHTNFYPLNEWSGRTRGPWINNGRARAAPDWTFKTCAVKIAGCVSRGGTQNISARRGDVHQWQS